MNFPCCLSGSAFRPLAHGGRRLASVASLVLGWAFAAGAMAEEVRVFSAEAFQPVVTAIAPAFAKRTGHTVVVVGEPGTMLAKRIRDGEDFDLAVLPPALLEALGKEGAVSDGSIIPLARAVNAAQPATVYAGAVSANASNSQAALSLLILLASEETQVMLKDKGLSAP
jgi:ABC-type molybdate transport system substrate-binding protein